MLRDGQRSPGSHQVVTGIMREAAGLAQRTGGTHTDEESDQGEREREIVRERARERESAREDNKRQQTKEKQKIRREKSIPPKELTMNNLPSTLLLLSP